MYARSTTVRGEPQRVDAGIAYVRDDALPAIQQLDGYIGHSMLVDRDSGRCIVTTSWLELDHLQQSREPLRPMRERARQVFGGDFAVHEWEIDVVHRVQPTGPDAWCRVVWTQAEPAQMTPLLDLFRAEVVPRAEELPGFCALSLMRDPRAGTSVTATTFTDREALDASREAAQALGALSSRIPFSVTDLAEFDVVMAHLRVPETV